MLELSTKLNEEQVKLDGKSYSLRQATGEAAETYRNAVLSATKLSNGKVSSVAGLASTESLLVSLCLFDSEGNAVHVKEIRKWPNPTVKALYDRAKEISDLDEKDEEKGKKSGSDSSDGTD